MIPADYVCANCKVTGVKLWGEYPTPLDGNTLLCSECASKDQGREIDLSVSDQCGWRVPAVPTLRGSWWSYSSVPAEGVEWWKALPMRLDGGWKVRGGWLHWYGDSLDAVSGKFGPVVRVDSARSMVLVFAANPVSQ